MEIDFLQAEDVAKYLGISIAQAYRVIHSMNEELKQEGYLTIRGKIYREYFMKKTSPVKPEDDHKEVG